MKLFKKNQPGFTLMELMITVSIIGVLAGVALPAYNDYVTRSRLTGLALRLDNIADLLKVYKMEHGDYPNDTHIIPPRGMTTPDEWYKETELGGNFNWEGPNNYSYAAISIFYSPTSKALEYTHDAELFDRMVDDGDLGTGNFQYTSNKRYTYIIEWN